MFRISENEIQITRGDTGRVELDITQTDGKPYERQPGDIVTFTVKKSTSDLTPIIQKLVGESNAFTIEPADTENLDYGPYFYDVQLVCASDNSVNTIIVPSLFIVEEEVTF